MNTNSCRIYYHTTLDKLRPKPTQPAVPPENLPPIEEDSDIESEVDEKGDLLFEHAESPKVSSSTSSAPQGASASRTSPAEAPETLTVQSTSSPQKKQPEILERVVSSSSQSQSGQRLSSVGSGESTVPIAKRPLHDGDIV
jgi:hypothetical protein